MKEGNAKLTSRCEAIRSQMFFYLDHELRDRELSDFEQHLESCIECRSLCDQERCLIESVRDSPPRHVASPELRDRITDILEQATEPYVAASPMRNRVQQILGFDQRNAAPRFAFHGMRALAFLVAMLLFAGFWFFQLRQAMPTPSEFAMIAVDSHSRRIRNQLFR